MWHVKSYWIESEGDKQNLLFSGDTFGAGPVNDFPKLFESDEDDDRLG